MPREAVAAGKGPSTWAPTPPRAPVQTLALHTVRASERVKVATLASLGNWAGRGRGILKPLFHAPV